MRKSRKVVPITEAKRKPRTAIEVPVPVEGAIRILTCSTDSAVHSKTRRHAHSEVPLTTGRAPSRIVLQSPCACPLHPPPNRFVLPAPTQTLKPAPTHAPAVAVLSGRIRLALRFFDRSITTPTTHYPAGSPEPALYPTTPPLPSDLLLPAHLPSVAVFDADLASTMTGHAREPVSREHNRSLDVRRAPIPRAEIDVGTKVGPRAL